MTDHAEARRRHALVGPADLWEQKRNFQISFLQRMGLRPGHLLLDLGCGTLRGGIPVIALLEAGHYYGLDARAEVLHEAEQELRDYRLENKSPTLLHSPDLSQLRIGCKFDFIWAFSVLIHLSDEILNDALGLVNDQLSRDGVFYANVNIGERNSGAFWREFPVVQRSLEFYSQSGLNNGLSVEDLGPLADFGHGPEMASGFQTDRRMLKMKLK
jgi:cyclopropane fatty-acyl-phospholipid synthase-like methyltransferase